MCSEETLMLKTLKYVEITCAATSLAQNKLSLPDPNEFVEIFSDYETHLKKLGSKLTKIVLPLFLQFFLSEKKSCNHFYTTK